MALVIQNHRALNFVALDHACATHVVPVAIASLDECMAAVGALVRFLLAVSFLMIDHVAELWCLDVALETSKKLIRSASLFVDHVMF